MAGVKLAKEPVGRRRWREAVVEIPIFFNLSLFFWRLVLYCIT